MKMKLIMTSIAAGSLLAAIAIAQPPRHARYNVTDLGTLPGGTFSQASGVSNNGLVTGVATTPDGTQHAVVWQGGRIIDITRPGSGRLNSGAFGVNERGQVDVQAETSAVDPNGEDFCGYFTNLICLPFLWQNGVATPLRTLGGNNGTVGMINNRGEVTGIAENSTHDPKCLDRPPDAPRQVLDFEAVIWGPKQGEIHRLPPFGNDTVGMAVAINDSGQAVGASGSCENTALPPLAFGPHAVLWEKDGSVHNLGNLGGAVVNMALSINNQGHVVGASSLTAHSTPFFLTHAFLWTRHTGIQDLHTLAGDVASAGLWINDRDQVVGVSQDASGNPRAFLWENGAMTDLNTLIPDDSPFLQLLIAGSINSRGEIAGFGVTSTGDVHAFLATPGNGGSTREVRSPAAQGVNNPPYFSEHARKLLRGGFGMRRR